MDDMKNIYDSNTPEWQLFENMRGSELAALAFQADADRALLKAVNARAKAELYRQALVKLTATE